MKHVLNDKVRNKINEIGAFPGLKDWIDNTQVALSDGHTYEVNSMNCFKRIKGKILSKSDLVVMKMASYYDRLEKTVRDFEDVEAILIEGLEFDNDLYERGLKFIKKSRYKLDQEKFKQVKDSF